MTDDKELIVNLTDALQTERTKNDQLRTALELTQDNARMVAFVTDIRALLNPSKTVEYFNSMFPEINKALADTKGLSIEDRQLLKEMKDNTFTEGRE